MPYVHRVESFTALFLVTRGWIRWIEFDSAHVKTAIFACITFTLPLQCAIVWHEGDHKRSFDFLSHGFNNPSRRIMRLLGSAILCAIDCIQVAIKIPKDNEPTFRQAWVFDTGAEKKMLNVVGNSLEVLLATPIIFPPVVPLTVATMDSLHPLVSY